MALYADSERGRYPVWQSLDHENFFPGSGIVFVTVTVRLAVSKGAQLLTANRETLQTESMRYPTRR